MLSEGYSTIPSVCCPSVSLLPHFLPLRATKQAKSATNGFSVTLTLFLSGKCVIEQPAGTKGN